MVFPVRSTKYNLIVFAPECPFSACLSVIYAFLVPSKIVGIPQVGSKMMMLTIEAAKLPFWGARGRRQKGQSIF